MGKCLCSEVVCSLCGAKIASLQSVWGIREGTGIEIEVLFLAPLTSSPCALFRRSLKLFYHQGECIVLRTKDSDVDEVQEIVTRLACVTSACEVSPARGSPPPYADVLAARVMPCLLLYRFMALGHKLMEVI